MTARSTTQKPVDPIRAALVDLVNWSKALPLWQRDALRRLYLSSDLSDEDVAELSNLCRHPHGLLEEKETPLSAAPLDLGHFPAHAAGSAPVSLKSIGHAKNVNALAEDQTLNFGETGLTIVYGDNGSGKSGYGRVLKRACRARDQETIIGNVYAAGTTPPASASIEFCVGGSPKAPIAWQDGTPTCAELSQISVFDSKCASIHVDGSNDLAYTPIPLHLLQSLAGVCRRVGDELREKKEILKNQTPSFGQRPSCHEGTAVHRLTLNLDSNTKLAEVVALSQLSEPEKVRLEQLKKDLAADPAKLIRRCKALKQRLDAIRKSVASTDSILSSTTSEELQRLFKEAHAKAQAARFAATEAFKSEPLPMVGSEVWKALWESARKFSTEEAYAGAPFPHTNIGAVCVLCQQTLSSEATQRLARFEQFVKENAQKLAEAARGAVQQFKKQVQNGVAPKETLREAVSLLRDELDRETLCRQVVRYLARGRVRAKRLVAASEPSSLLSQSVPATVLPLIDEVVEAANRRIRELEKGLNPEQRKLQEKELHELQDRVWLATILKEVEAEIGRLRRIGVFDAAIRDADTGRITRKTTEISKLLVTDTMRDAFAAEVSELGLSDRRIELVQAQSGYGSPRFRVSLIRNRNADVGKVLSEGENRCIALAAFFAELSTAHSRSGIVFEDPVSSLDHNYRETVAKRLVKEAVAGRQVIVFTHDIAFLMALDEEACQNGIPPEYQTINRAADTSGICAAGTPAKAQGVQQLLERVERRLQSGQTLYTAGQLDDWWEHVKVMAGRLRDAWEIAAERVVSPVLQRFGNKVRTGGLRKLTVLTAQDCDELKEGYAFCCLYCHTDGAAVNRPAPTPIQIRDEIQRLKNWFASVQARQKAIT